MNLTDGQLEAYVSNKLALPGEDRNEFRQQVSRLLDNIQKVLDADGSYKIKCFRRGGSLEKGTSNRARAGKAVDADVGVYFEITDTNNFDMAALQTLIKKLLSAAYPQKSPEDFDETGARTFGVVFKGSGLEVDLVPIVSLDAEGNYGFQYSRSGDCVKTSVKVHIDHYRGHARKDPLLASLLRMAKRWCYWQELDGVQSFHLELIISYLIDRDGAAETLEEGLRRLFLFIMRDLTHGIVWDSTTASAFPDAVVILDPASSENNVASRIENNERDVFVKAAQTAFETITLAQGLQFKGETISLWKELFGDNFEID